jgi:hypothetical protein
MISAVLSVVRGVDSRLALAIGCSMVEVRAGTRRQPCLGSHFRLNIFSVMSISAKPKKRGRPATGRNPMIGLRVSPDLRERIERWATAQSDTPLLSEAIRRLVELGLASPRRTGARTNKAAKASEMAGHEIDRLGDPSVTDQERQLRKRRLIKGPTEFRDIRSKRAKG